MEFDFRDAIPLLSRTPAVLDALLRDLPSGWTAATEGPDTWSAYDVLGHLIHGERTDWMPRVDHLLKYGDTRAFPVFDRFIQFEASKGKTMAQLLDTFRELRAESLRRLEALRLTPDALSRTGLHPELGTVTLGQHLATWVTHDLDHVVQIARVLGRQYGTAVGPWRQYIRILGPA